MTAQPETGSIARRDTTDVLVWGAWALIIVLITKVGAEAAAILGPVDVAGAGIAGLAHQFGRVLVQNLPTFLIIGALADIAGFFGRCGEGAAFTDRNVKTLRSAAEGLIWAAAASAVITPTVLGWINLDFRGVAWALNDLALGVGAMGCALWGVALVWGDAVRLKQENDEII